MALRTAFKGMGTSRQDVREYACGERDDVLHHARNDKSEHSEGKRASIAAQIWNEAEKIFPGGGFLCFFGAGGCANGCCGRAHRSFDLAVESDGVSIRKCS